MKHFALSLLGLMILAGCRSRESIPILSWFFGKRKTEAGAPSGQNDTPPGGDEPNINILIDLALWATWAGAVCFIVAVPVFVWVSRPLAGRIAVSGLGLIVASQILIWVGEHLAWLSAIVLIVTLALACWKYRKKIVNRAECFLDKDLNGDMVVCGEPVKPPLQS